MTHVLAHPTQHSSPPQAVTERRGWVRFPTNLDGACQPIPLPHASDPESLWQGKVVNVSASGLCLHLVRRFEPGTPLIFELTGAPGESNLLLTGTVVRVADRIATGWVLGCQFDQPLTKDQLDALLQATDGGQARSNESKDTKSPRTAGA